MGRNRIIGPALPTLVAGIAFLSYWLLRVVAWPGAVIETAVVFPLAALIVWSFLRVGVWIDGEQLVMRNMWRTHRFPVDGVRLLAGQVDDISDFDRFTGGYANHFRAEVGDSFADRTFLRHCLVADGEQYDIDAMFGRTPRSQRQAADKIRQALEGTRVGQLHR